MPNSLDITSRLGLPFILPSQAQKHVTHNEALQRLDLLTHPTVIDRDLIAPPAGADEGACYIVGPGATGLWAGHQGEIAIREAGAWSFLPASAGLKVYVEDEQIFLFSTGSAWIEGAGGEVGSFGRISVNAATDPLARLSVQSDAVKFSHDALTPGSGDVRAYLNKSAAGNTASVVYQTSFSGRAEFGLAGSDDFSLKVSPDGAVWKTALSVDRVSGTATVPTQLVVGSSGTAASGPLTVARTQPSVAVRSTTGTGNTHLGWVNFVDADGVEKVFFGLGSTSNSLFTLMTQYADGLLFLTSGGDYPIEFRQHTSVRLKVHTNGNVGIRESAPTAPLHVNGAIRTGQYTVATLPSASSLGAGSIVFVSNEAGGATLAFSDGSSWRRVQDRQIVA